MTQDKPRTARPPMVRLRRRSVPLLEELSEELSVNQLEPPPASLVIDYALAVAAYSVRTNRANGEALISRSDWNYHLAQLPRPQ